MTDRSVRIENLPPPNKYWGKPALDKQGDKTAEEIFLEVGRCLSKWESCESLFAELFKYFIESKSNAARRAYGYIIVGRDEVIKGAAEEFFLKNNVNNETEDNFKLIMKHRQKASELRNEIAHGNVAKISELFNDKNCFGHFLIPAFYNSRKNKLNRPYKGEDKIDMFDMMGQIYFYKAYHIKCFCNKFEVLQTCVTNFWGDLIKNYSNGQTVDSR